jgi:hypothetical protein
MSLTGHLDVFALEEVLRLLARSYKTGCLRVDAGEVHGRVYLSSGTISFITAGTDDDLRRQLLRAGVADDESLRAMERGSSWSDPSTTRSQGLSNFVREEVVESLYRIRRPGRGQFVFNADVAPRYPIGQSFDVEMTIADADRRAADWADIEAILPSVELPIRIVTDVEGDITVSPFAWKLISAMGGIATPAGLADGMGLSRFVVAREVADLMHRSLLEPAVQTAEHEPEREPEAEAEPYSYETFAPAATADTALQETYGDEPIADTAPAFEESNQAEETQAPAAGVDGGWWVEPDRPSGQAADESAPEGQGEGTPLADGFLERVFAQLEETDAEGTAEQPSIGHGFLKRRRMSSLTPEDLT